MTELENLPQDASRSAYTQRILEIVGNIKKQKEEITKVCLEANDWEEHFSAHRYCVKHICEVKPHGL